MDDATEIEGRDIPLDLLVPLNERDIDLEKNAGFKKIVSSIKAIGLVEPLCVYREGERYVILDGFLRFKACQLLEIDTVPCILFKDKQAYTFNRNVNKLSAYQEIRMLQKAAEAIPEPEIASAFGMKTIQHRLTPWLLKQLTPAAAQLFKVDKLTRLSARELTCVKPKRQEEILKEMAAVGDYSAAFCRSFVIKTPPEQMNAKNPLRRRTWAEDTNRKKDIISRLENAEKQHDFYQKLYRQYSTDLLKMSIYVRNIIANTKMESYLAEKHGTVLDLFKAVVSDKEPDGKD